jgi:hypothetical protein
VFTFIQNCHFTKKSCIQSSCLFSALSTTRLKPIIINLNSFKLDLTFTVGEWSIQTVQKRLRIGRDQDLHLQGTEPADKQPFGIKPLTSLWRRSFSFNDLRELISLTRMTALFWVSTTQIICSPIWNKDPHNGTI